MDSKKIIAVAAVAIIAIAACAVIFTNGDDDSDSKTMVDAAGNQIKKLNGVDSITGCSSSIVDTICYMGYGDKLVGVVSYCNNPLIPADVKICGSYYSPDTDAISTVNADVSFLDNSGSGSKAAYDTLKASGMNVVLTFGSDDGYEGIYKNIEIFGYIFGCEDKADDIIDEMRDSVEDISENTKSASPTKVIITTGLGSLWGVDENGNFDSISSFDGSGVYAAGVESTASELISKVAKINNPVGGNSWSPLDTDYISTQTSDVEVILVTWGDSAPNADAHAKLIEQMKKTAWANCAAVQNGNVIFVCEKANDDISRTTPYTVFNSLPVMSLYMNPECYKAPSGETLTLDDLPYFIDNSNYEILKGYTEN
ncbi:MAG: ABC transporter substrate-binding protein [Candidatus Methanomethylophilaceae archaeon]|nr:ABC transporter substrate-binding protein [Candidatus Methanomethylophilaceae archaeon]